MIKIFIAFVLMIGLAASCAAQAVIPISSISAINGVPIANISAINGQTLSSGGGAVVSSVVQSTSTGSASGVTTVTVNGVTAGNIAVVALYSGPFGVALNFTQTRGSGGTVLSTGGLAGDDDAVSIVCAPITSSGNDVFTFTRNGDIVPMVGVVYEVHTTHGTCTTEGSVAVADTTGTSCASNKLTTTTANDFVVAMCGTTGGPTPVNAGPGWSGGLTANFNTNGIYSMSEYQIGITPGSFAATSSTFPSSEQATAIVAIKP